MDKKSKADLVALCKEKGIRGYSGKNKEDLIQLLATTAATAEPADQIEHVMPTTTEPLRQEILEGDVMVHLASLESDHRS
jgi:Rho termination factor, N-terminal domain